MKYYPYIYEPIASLPLRDTVVPVMANDFLKKTTLPNQQNPVYDEGIFDRFDAVTGNNQPISVQQFMNLNGEELLQLSNAQISKVLEIASYQLLVKSFYDHGGISRQAGKKMTDKELRLHNLKALQQTLSELKSFSDTHQEIKPIIQDTGILDTSLQALPFVTQLYHVMQDFFVARFRRYVIDEAYDSLKGPLKRIARNGSSMVKGRRFLPDQPILNDERDFTQPYVNPEKALPYPDEDNLPSAQMDISA